MTPVQPTIHTGATLIVFGSSQPEYIPLPASVDGNGTVMTEWVLTPEECSRLMCGGHLRLWLIGTDVQKGRPLTPIRMDALLPDDHRKADS